MTIKGTDKALKLLQEVSREFNVGIATLRGPLRWKQYREIRQIFAARGRALDIGVLALAAALDRDHSTISYYLHRERFLKKRRDHRRAHPPSDEQRYHDKLRKAGVAIPGESNAKLLPQASRD